MTVENLFTDVLNNLVKAQYESYVFSQRLGEQDYNLLPIPTAEIKEITLDVNYAYEKKDETILNENYDTSQIFKRLSNLIKKNLVKYQKNIIDEIDVSDVSANLKWIEVKKNLQSGKLIGFMLKDIKKPFIDNLDTLFNKTQTNTIQYDQNVISLLTPLIQETVERNILKHPDMKEFINNIDMQGVYEKIKHNFTKNIEEIDDIIKSSVKFSPKNLNIVIDAQVLKELPPDAIQNAKVVMKMRNIIVEK